jgi:hypothetical protein
MTSSRRSRSSWPLWSSTSILLTTLTLLSVGFVGCGQRGSNALYEISGSVAFAGKPVPAGRIVFEPDTTRGAKGIVSIADIANGSYRTRPQRGFGGGPCRVTIYGTDGTMPTEEKDTSLFPPWQTTLDLPREACRRDFDVPADTARQPAQSR